MREARFLDLARRMIATRTVTTEGTAVLARLLADDVLATIDVEVSLQPGPSPSDANLVATKALDAGSAVLWNSHLDTVPPGDPALWTTCGGDPFSPTLDGDRLYGLGTADAKLDWLCKAEALRRVRGRRFRRGMIFAGTFGEESGLRGARALAPLLPVTPVAAWVGEPSGLRPVLRHKGLLVVAIDASSDRPAAAPESASRFVVRGRSAHSSTPELGENAILEALGVVRRLGLRIASIRGGDAANKVPDRCEVVVLGRSSALPPELAATESEPASPLPEPLVRFLEEVVALERSLVASSRRDEAFAPPGLTSNLGRIDARNGLLRALLDFRSLPGDRTTDVVRALRALARETSGIAVTVDVERDNAPLDTPLDSDAVVWTIQTLAELGLDVAPGTKAGCTEAGVYRAAGIPAVVIGPGRSAGNIHAPNEHVTLGDLERAVEFYERLLEHVCLA